MVLQSDKQQKLREKKDVNIKRLKDGLALYNQENDTSYAIAETRVQGSMAMATVVQNDENDCDIDVAIVFDQGDETLRFVPLRKDILLRSLQLKNARTEAYTAIIQNVLFYTGRIYFC